MTGNLNLARPYALAAFDYAVEKQELSRWETMLEAASAFSQDEKIQQLLKTPQVTTQNLANIFTDALKSVLDEESLNFICLLSEYKRLNLLPDILSEFKNLRAQYEKSITVEVKSASPLSESYLQKLIDALTKRLHQKVTLQCSEDPALIAGVVVRANDQVIDGSVRGKLNRLLESL